MRIDNLNEEDVIFFKEVIKTKTGYEDYYDDFEKLLEEYNSTSDNDIKEEEEKANEEPAEEEKENKCNEDEEEEKEEEKENKKKNSAELRNAFLNSGLSQKIEDDENYKRGKELVDGFEKAKQMGI